MSFQDLYRVANGDAQQHSLDLDRKQAEKTFLIQKVVSQK